MLLRSWTRGTRPRSSSLRQSTSKSFPDASSSPSSLRRRVAVELSCHSAVVAAVFPASSPPRRLVSAPSSFHRAVIGPSRRSSVRLGAPSVPVFGASRCTVVVVPVVATLRCRRTAVVAQVVIATLRCSPAQHRHRRSRHQSSDQSSSPFARCRRSRHHRRRRRRRIVAALRPASPANMQDLVSRHSPSRRRRFHAVVWLWDNICNTALGNIWGVV